MVPSLCSTRWRWISVVGLLGCSLLLMPQLNRVVRAQTPRTAVIPEDTINFSTDRYEIAENGGSITITLERTNGGDTGRRVEFYAYTMYCGDARVARADRDYIEVHDRPFFAPRETSKSYTITILDDNLLEGDEVICLGVYTDESGETLASAGLIIRDDEQPPAQIVSTLHLPLVNVAPYTLRCNPTQGVGGLAPGRYETTVAGRKAMVVVGRNYNPAQPTLLVFYLNGDEGDYKLLTGNSRTRQLVDERGWIMVSPRSLGDERADVIPWRVYFAANKAKLSEIFETIFSQYNVCRDILLGSAVSGGSFFWDIFFFPGKGLDYPAFMLLNCGAGPWFANPHAPGLVSALGQDPTIVARTRVKLSYGSDDFLVPNIQDSIQRLRGAGFTVVVDEMAGRDHCDFDIDDKTRDYWSEVANELQPVLFPPLHQ